MQAKKKRNNTKNNINGEKKKCNPRRRFASFAHNTGKVKSGSYTTTPNLCRRDFTHAATQQRLPIKKKTAAQQQQHPQLFSRNFNYFHYFIYILITWLIAFLSRHTCCHKCSAQKHSIVFSDNGKSKHCNYTVETRLVIARDSL